MMTWAMATALALSTLAPGPTLPGWEEVVAVPAELRAQLDAQVLQRARTPEQRLPLLAEFMFDPAGLALEYDDGATRTVAEVYRDRRGNCLSFTLAFVTLARQAGLDAYVQELDQVLVSSSGEDTVFHSGHVNASVRVAGRRYTVDFDSSIIAARHPPKTISDRRALAHFYNNRGAERMAAQDYPAAGTYLDAVLALEPEFVPGWNNRGVLHSRTGDQRAAEHAYLTVLDQESEHVPALSNLVGLYRLLGDDAKLAAFQRRLEDALRHDPYRHFILGLQHESRGEYAQALDYFQQAIRLHRSEPQFHFAIARVQYRLGDARRAERALERAYALSEGEARDLYRRKLQALRD